MTSNNNKNYYKILGVQEDADELVIRASYLALLKRYNLDDWKGDKQQAIKILADINEAYSVLKDRYERLEYNSSMVKNKNEEVVESIQSNMSAEEVDAAWNVACNYYQDLGFLYLNLFQVSEQVANNFKLSILSSKDYSNRNKLASKLELDYLRSQFGNDQDLIEFGKELILEEAKEAVAELHHVVNVMGNAVHSEEVIDKISEKFQTVRFIQKLKNIEIARQSELLRKDQFSREQKEREAEEKRFNKANKTQNIAIVVFIIALVLLFIFAVKYSNTLTVTKKSSLINPDTVVQKTSVNSGIENAYYWEKVTLLGLVLIEEGFAYEGGVERRIAYPTLNLSSPINVTSKNAINPAVDEPPEFFITTIQLVSSMELIDKYSNSSVTVVCRLFHAIKGHHMTPVLCDVQEIRHFK